MDKRLIKTEKWDEGLPLGNGKTGSLVYGSNPLKITVDRTDLWDLRPNEITLEKDFNFKNLVKLSLSGKEEDWKERERLFEDIFMDKPYPSKITAGHIELDFGKTVKNIRYSLDIDNAIVKIYDDNRLIAEVFVFVFTFPLTFPENPRAVRDLATMRAKCRSDIRKRKFSKKTALSGTNRVLIPIIRSALRRIV